MALACISAFAATGTVSIDNFAFSAPTITVKAGSEVVWDNHDDDPHSIVAKDGSFHSKALDTDDSYSFTFTKAGTFAYYCGLHPFMQGTVVVEP